MSTMLDDDKGDTHFIEQAPAVQSLAYEHNSKIDAVNKGHVADLSLEERQTAWELARQVDPGPRWYTRRGILFVFYCLVVTVGGADGTFDGTLMSSIISMTVFLKYFHIPAIASAGTGMLMGIGQVGGVAAFFPAAWLPDKFGRKWSLIIANVLVILGAIVTGTAQSRGAFMGGRFILGLSGVGASGMYVGEITHAANRGRWLGICNLGWYIGNIMATAVAIPFGLLNTNLAWRIPLLIPIGPALINTFFIPFIPESPRWLVAHGQRDKALKVLAQLHSQHNDVESPVVQLMIQEIENAIQTDGADQKLWSFGQIFKGRANRIRWWMGTIISVWGQLSGQGAVNYFFVGLLQQAGITSGNEQRVLNMANSVTSFGCAMLGSLIVDKVGRRPMFFWAEGVAICSLAIIAGLVSPAGTKSVVRANAGISFMILFSALFSLGMTPLQRVYATEVFKFENRAKAIALQSLVMTLCGCITQFGLPPMLAALGYKTYFVFLAFDVVGIIIMYLYVVETKQLSLEDLDAVFESSHPRNTSLALVRDAKAMAKRERQTLAGEA